MSEVFLQLGRLIHQRREASGKKPYLIGIGGSVAVGKSTFASALGGVIARSPVTMGPQAAPDPRRPSVSLISTDCFLYPNRILAERDLMMRKGFPESYDRARMLSFVEELRAGREEVRAPVYSHRVYDIVEGEETVIRRPDVVILEGLNVLDPALGLDLTIYLDAAEEHLIAWYKARFLANREAALGDPGSYFRKFIDLSPEAVAALAGHIWAEINGKNLREHILPTRERARVIVHKGADHAAVAVSLREGG